jgi:energy-converting hydrogenase Eha subunit G
MSVESTAPKDDVINALIVGGVPIVCALILYGIALKGSDLQGWVLLPGLIIGISVILSGNPHGGALQSSW